MNSKKLIAGFALGLGCSPLCAQSIEWLAADGLWSEPTNWSGGNIPDLHTEFPILSGMTPYRVEFDNSFVFGTLSITNPGVQLDINAGFTATLVGDIHNNGLIVINPDAQSDITRIDLLVDTTITGIGTLRLNAQVAPGNSRLIGSGQITNAVDHTIAGSGVLEGVIVNAGTIIADNPAGTELWLKGTYDQDPTGIIRASTNDIKFQTATTIVGGTLASDPGARIYTNAPVELRDLTNTAQFEFTSVQPLTLAGQVVNDGHLYFETDIQSVQNSKVYIDEPATLSGTGTLTLYKDTWSPNSNIVQVAENITFTHANGHTIAGGGVIEVGRFSTFFNEGTINANMPGQWLAIVGIFEGDGNYMAQDGCRLNISRQPNLNTTIQGGTFHTFGTGSVRIHSNLSVRDITNNGSVLLVGSNAVTNFHGQITNNGTIEVDTDLRAYIDTTFSGTGTMTLLNSGASIGVIGDSLITNAAGHTIQGPGTISGPFVNNGTIANTIMIAGPFTNNGSVVNTSERTLVLEGQHGPGIYDAGDSIIELQSCTMTGATLNAGPDGFIRYITQTHFVDIVNNALLRSFTSEAATIEGTFTNNADVLLVGNNSQTMLFMNTMTIEGQGLIDLQGTTPVNQPRLVADGSSVVTINPDHTIRGHGKLLGTFINQGTLDPFKISVHNFTPAISADDLSLGSTSHVNLDILDPLNKAQYLAIEENGTLVLGGTLNIAYSDGVESDFGQWVIIDGLANAQILGDFDQVNFPTTPSNRRFRLRRETGKATLVLTCPSDINADFSFNFFDVSAFLSAFNAQTPEGDFNQDGEFNFFDVSAFLAAFSTPCQ